MRSLYTACKNNIFFLVLLLSGIGASVFAPQAHAVPAFDTSSSSPNYYYNVELASWPHTTGNYQDRILIVGISQITVPLGDNTVLVTYNGRPLTRFYTQTCPSIAAIACNMQLWYLLNPDVGTHTIQTTGIAVGGAATYYNVSQNPATALGTPVNNTGASFWGGSLNPSLSMSGTTTNDMLINYVTAVGIPFDRIPPTVTARSGQPRDWTSFRIYDAYGLTNAGSHRLGGGTVAFNWSAGTISNGGGGWMDVGFTLRSPVITPTPIPTATPTPSPTPTLGAGSIYTVTGNIFLDNNKNSIKDAGEQNYAGNNTITSSNGTATITPLGTYTITNIAPGAVTVSYPTLPTGYSLTYPLNGPPPSFTVNVGPGCTTNGANSATCTGGNITNLNFGITNAHPWFQLSCGDIRNDNGITNLLPSGEYMLTTSPTCTTPGIAFSGDSFYDFGGGNASATDRVTGGSTYPEVYSPSSASGITTSYNYLAGKATKSQLPVTDLSSVCTVSNCTLPANLPKGVYQAEEDVLLNAFTAPADTHYVFLIDGNLTLRGDILVPTSSTLLFSASGNTTVAATIGSPANAATPNIEGIYSSDRSFIIASTGTCNDERLTIRGNIITNAARNGGSFQNQRDLCANNTTFPTVSLTQRLDFLLNLPEFIQVPHSISWEGTF